MCRRDAHVQKNTKKSPTALSEAICRKGAAAVGCVCTCVCGPLPSCGCVYSGSCLLCTLACSGEKALFHSPSTMPYQSPNLSPDCNSLPNLNLHAGEQIAPLSSPPHPEDPPSHAMAKMYASPSAALTSPASQLPRFTEDGINRSNG